VILDCRGVTRKEPIVKAITAKRLSFSLDIARIKNYNCSYILGTVFSGVCRTIIDDRCDYGEERYVTFGALQGRTVIIVHTKRGDKTRIISMRKANSREQRYYLQQLISH
jgi:uncharacterized protein